VTPRPDRTSRRPLEEGRRGRRRRDRTIGPDIREARLEQGFEVAGCATARSDRTSGRPDWRRAVEVADAATP
jgi:hypothetical protein